jgi:exocyst complex component 3
MRPALDAFLRNAEHSASAAAATVICDPSVVDLFGHLFLIDKTGGGDWIQGEVTETLAATIADYLEDVQQYVAREHASKVTEAVLSRVINSTIEACLRQLTSIRPGTVERMEADENALRECFEDHVQESVLESALQRFSAIRDLASADDAESFVLAYGLLVRSAPELGLEPAERLLAAHEDIPRAAQREVLDQCRELIRSVTVSTSAR